jgi:hypothetical protein
VHNVQLALAACTIRAGTNLFLKIFLFELGPQSNELTRGTIELVQHFRLYGEFTSARELLEINLIWFGTYIARLSEWGEVGYFISSNYFYLPWRRL